MIDPTEIVEIRTPAGTFLGRMSTEQYEAICAGANERPIFFRRRLRIVAAWLGRALSNAMLATLALVFWFGVIVAWQSPDAVKALGKFAYGNPEVAADRILYFGTAYLFILLVWCGLDLKKELARSEVEAALIRERLADTLKVNRSSELVVLVRRKAGA